MRVLITGASGFVGTYLIRHLQATRPDCEIVGTTHSAPPAAPEGRVRFIRCDILAQDGQAIADIVRDARPDHVYHLAGMASGASSDKDAVLRANVDGTRFVVQAVRAHAPQARLLFTSTGYVYGACDPAHPAQENDPLAPPGAGGPYADSKRVAEQWIESHGGGVIIARAFNHTGPEQTAAFAIPAFAAQIIQIERGAQTELRVGNLEAERDFLDVRDVARAYALLLDNARDGVYNVCSGQPRRMGDVLDALCAEARPPIPVTQDPARMRPADLPVSVGDPGRLCALTGWQPQIPWAQTLRETLDWWRARPARAG